MEVTITGGAVFWMFMIVVLIVDSYFFSRGYDSVFQKHKTPEEKAIQRYKIKILRLESELLDLQVAIKRDLHAVSKTKDEIN